MLAVDAAREPLEHGPGTYIGLAGNLLPGWTLALLALALLLAPAVAGFGGVAVAAGSPVQAARAIGWVALRAVPFLLGFVLLALAALVGLVPSPEFPFLPGAEELGLGGTIAVVVAIAGLRGQRLPAAPAAAAAAVAGPAGARRGRLARGARRLRDLAGQPLPGAAGGAGAAALGARGGRGRARAGSPRRAWCWRA